jgi:argininosuccinate lyase
MITTFGHILVGLTLPLERDLKRLMNWCGLFNQNPLGGAAGYGTSFPLDRDLTSRLLAFDGPESHSTDPITNRWEPEADLAFAISVTMSHLSAMAQTFILMSTTEFGMIRLDDIHCSGSSIMPQKRNPDPLEVIKAKASLAHGVLMSLISIGKDSMVGYNRESQWTKYLVMDLFSECAPAPVIMAEIIDLMEVNEPAMARQAEKGFVAANHLLEEITKHAGLPIRQAKMLVERAVRYAEKAGREAVTLADLNRAMGEMDLHVQLKARDITRWQNLPKLLEEGGIAEGPSPSATRENISSLAKRLREYRKWRRDRSGRIQGALREIESIEKGLGIGPEPS